MNKLVAIIQGLFAPASVASVLSSFTKTIDKLEKVAEQNLAIIDKHSATIEELNAQIDRADDEADTAKRTAARLRAFLQ